MIRPTIRRGGHTISAFHWFVKRWPHQPPPPFSGWVGPGGVSYGFGVACTAYDAAVEFGGRDPATLEVYQADGVGCPFGPASWFVRLVHPEGWLVVYDLDGRQVQHGRLMGMAPDLDTKDNA